MLIRHLFFFVTLAQEKHFGRAARACNVSQPTLSSAIQKLEKELGTQLLERGQSYGGLTADGQKVLAWGKQILENHDRLRNALRESPAVTPPDGVHPKTDSGLLGHSRQSAIQIYAAGSLSNALSAVTSSFSDMTGIPINVQHGPIGPLRERIEAGDRPDLFLSADFANSSRLAELGLARAPIVFARNTMCALVRRDAQITQSNLVDRMLNPEIHIGAVTPAKGLSGDYTWDIFRRVERVRPGAFAVLDLKTHKFKGNPLTRATQIRRDAIAQSIDDGTIDICFGYLTGMRLRADHMERAELIEIPTPLNVVPEYTIAPLVGCRPAALSFALFLMSASSQALFEKFGFTPVAVPAAARQI
ncbi:LysR family transcriptional regulator [Mesorhizobium sp. SP-1A]|uniref:LysR family transcriptional regulator n=1 Tax=Mesorhizobium sp. SP-1A TaxID=3077840 RepID=UPI0028F71645|nr:substrate-binding domain-containing protein [Mesorhizobium sp. SP-1A]